MARSRISALPASSPPAISNVPSASTVALWPARGRRNSRGRGTNDPVAGSNSSVASRRVVKWRPPEMSTRPSPSSVAVWSARATTELPTTEKPPEAGSKISAWLTGPLAVSPPTIRMRPSASRVAVCPARAICRSGVPTTCAHEVGANEAAVRTTATASTGRGTRAFQKCFSGPPLMQVMTTPP